MGYNNKVTRTGLLTKNRLLSKARQEPVVSYNNAILLRRQTYGNYQFSLFFHPHVELIDGGQEYEHREYQRQHHTLLIAAEKSVETAHRGYMREQCAQDIHHGVVDPMDGHTGQDASRAVIHPAEQQTNKEGMGHLGRI